MKRNHIRFTFIMAIFALCSASFALTVSVDPLGGGDYTDLDAAVTAVIAQGDSANTINIQNTAVHDLSANASGLVWAFGAQSVDFVGNSAVTRPVIVMPNRSSGRFELDISNASSTPTLTFRDLTFIPDTGLSYGNNTNDGFSFSSCAYVLENVLMSANDGSDGPASTDGSVRFAAGPNYHPVGDDWAQWQSGCTAVTIDGCVITGAWDDGALFGATPATINNGSVISNNGGAGIQIFSATDLNLVGTPSSRISISQNGNRPGADVNLKTFSSGSTITATMVDFIECRNGNYSDFSGAYATFDDCRFSSGAQDLIADRGQIAIYASGANATFNRCTFHDAGNDKAIYVTGSPTLTFNDCIFSGAGDFFEVDSATIGGSNNAVVTEGPDAVADATGAPPAVVSQDPLYASYDYAIGIGAVNPTTLQVTNCFYDGQASDAADLVGGAGGTIAACPSAVDDWINF